jgi:hypothetical protein
MLSSPPLKIFWDETFDVEIWEYFSKASTPRFRKRALDDDERKRRRMEVQLNKGELYHVVLYKEGDPANPNQTLEDPPPRAQLTVLGIVDTRRDMISMPDPIARGGTYLEGFVATRGDGMQINTNALMQAGKTAPVEVPGPGGAPGPLRINNATAEVISIDKHFHSLECKPLVPGELYSVVILVVDESGNWDCVEDTLNTKLRQVNIAVKEIYVTNCGDSDVGEAEFRVTVEESGSSGAVHTPAAWALGNDEYEVRTGQRIAVPWTTQIGPKAITATVDDIVRVRTIGFEYDGIEGTENAGSDYHPLTIIFPVGRDLEEAEETDVTVNAWPLRDDDFAYDITVDWKVTYV